MSGIKVWDGSAFVDPSAYRIWDGSGFVSPSSMHRWDGSQFVKVWPSLTRQRMNKASRQAVGSGSWTTITGWSSDSTYPAAVSGDGLLVAGSGSATINLSWTLDTAFSTIWNVRVLRNGATVYTSPDRSADGLYAESFSLAVADGDVLTVQAYRGSNAATMYFDVPSYLEVVPN